MVVRIRSLFREMSSGMGSHWRTAKKMSLAGVLEMVRG